MPERPPAPGSMIGLTLVCACLAVSFFLTACEVAPATEVAVLPTAAFPIEAAPSEAPVPVTGTVLLFWEPYALDRPMGLLLGEMVRDFHAANPEIEVDIVAKSGTVGLHESLLSALPDGELPNLAVAFPGMISTYAAQGAVIPLDPFLVDAENGLGAEELADFFPGLIESGKLPGYGGQMMSFPFAQNALGLWVNQSLLELAGWDSSPKTWSEFEQACYDIWAYAGRPCYPVVESVTTFDAWLRSRGGQQIDETARRATFQAPPGVESLELIRRLLEVGLAWRPTDTYGDYVAFTSGEAAFAFSSTGSSRLYAEAYAGAVSGGMAPFRWTQTLIPQADPNLPATSLVGTNFFILPSDPEHEMAAWKLVRWFTLPEQTARWAASMEAMPVRVSAQSVMTETLGTYPFVRAQMEEIMPYARPEPSLPESLAVREVLYTAIVSVTQGYSGTQEALDVTASKVNALLGSAP
ncbi:MAG TPA: extracellular solute-binding protein [Anaerolineae bacterium]|nr:extracellular solute-binding protein [Anaerolineae bacterium]